MAMATTPYLSGTQWMIDVDPDDINFVVWDVTKDLADRATTAAACTLVTTGVLVQQGPTVQGTLIIALVKMAAGTPLPSATARVTCANGEQFDRTVYFNLESH